MGEQNFRQKKIVIFRLKNNKKRLSHIRQRYVNIILKKLKQWTIEVRIQFSLYRCFKVPLGFFSFAQKLNDFNYVCSKRIEIHFDDGKLNLLYLRSWCSRIRFFQKIATMWTRSVYIFIYSFISFLTFIIKSFGEK